MGILLWREKGSALTEVEGDALFDRYRAAYPVTLSGGAVTLNNGTARYKISTENAADSDDLTTIVLAAENVEGCMIMLQAATAGQTVVVKHQGNLHLLNGEDFTMDNIYKSIDLLHMGSGVWVEVGRSNVL